VRFRQIRRDTSLDVEDVEAETLAGTGVTVNAILPGPTRPEGLDNMIARVATEQGITPVQVERDFIGTQRAPSPIRRLTTVEEVASLAVYLASEQASATTGAAMRVDGGVVRSVL
jgi:NAD(P)-dependent dehydrogenase (short-subunit alcohol dehydrogenase family)